MTDKEQIIIGGVDVAGCKYFNRFRNICRNKNLCCDCEKNQDCYYKQLKRKTQECKELEAYAQRQENQREEYYKEYLKLSQEYEALKSESFTREKLITLQEKDIDRYRKALEEIEEYCNKQISFIGDLPFRTTESDILDIINKAKEEE